MWTWISRYQHVSVLDFIGAKVVVTTGAIRRAKLQPKYHYQQTNTQFLLLPVAQPTCTKVLLVSAARSQTTHQIEKI